MDKGKKKTPLSESCDSLSGIVSSCEMTGLEPALAKTESEENSYMALGGPVPLEGEWPIVNGK